MSACLRIRSWCNDVPISCWPGQGHNNSQELVQTTVHSFQRWPLTGPPGSSAVWSIQRATPYELEETQVIEVRNLVYIFSVLVSSERKSVMYVCSLRRATVNITEALHSMARLIQCTKLARDKFRGHPGYDFSEHPDSPRHSYMPRPKPGGDYY